MQLLSLFLYALYVKKRNHPFQLCIVAFVIVSLLFTPSIVGEYLEESTDKKTGSELQRELDSEMTSILPAPIIASKTPVQNRFDRQPFNKRFVFLHRIYRSQLLSKKEIVEQFANQLTSKDYEIVTQEPVKGLIQANALDSGYKVVVKIYDYPKSGYSDIKIELEKNQVTRTASL